MTILAVLWQFIFPHFRPVQCSHELSKIANPDLLYACFCNQGIVECSFEVGYKDKVDLTGPTLVFPGPIVVCVADVDPNRRQAIPASYLHNTFAFTRKRYTILNLTVIPKFT